MSTFSTHDVTIGKPFGQPSTAKAFWERKFSEYDWRSRNYIPKAKVWGHSEGNFLPGSRSALVDAVGTAYNQHVPLALSPDAVWTVIAHGFSMWINENAEAVRDKFVKHQGKAELKIEVQANPDWDDVMGQFSDCIAEHIGPQRILFINDFSTTGRDARIGSEALLMYGMAKYFDYGMTTCCGFPSITLEGTPDDWHKIADRVAKLREYILGDDDHLKVWLTQLEPVVEEFARAAEGKPDLDFWRSLYKEGGGSGGPYITGHVLKFYPYLKDYHDNVRPNEFPKEDHGKWGGGGLTFDQFPKSFSPVDVKWDRLGTEMDMVFQGGLVGVTYDEGVVRPTVGWCVSETLEVPDEQEAD